ncbi:FUSC family protein [Hyphomicrobium sp. DY-1]|uniref:FUSC family protein n=1 Tax=Hyphomicrobium sp. DY-1 TaxID=3075650 RepID=UPI0039C3E310
MLAGFSHPLFIHFRKHSSQIVTQTENLARESLPALLFGLRLWASTCLALYVAFRLELDNAFWAGTTAAIVCQPHLGASLRKGWFRMLGTLVGAVAIVILTALFPQDRIAFLSALALWCGASAFVATLLRNFASYAAALSGFTAAVIATDQLGAVGGLNGDAFMLAIQRSTEIILGIVCAGVILAATDFGGARRRLAASLASLTADIATGIDSTLRAGAQNLPFQPIRRDLTRRVIALDPVIDEAIGESAGLRYHSSVLRGTMVGMFAALSAWRGIAARLANAPETEARKDADAVLNEIPLKLRDMSQQGRSGGWLSDPVDMQRQYRGVGETLRSSPFDTPSTRLIADQTAKALFGIAQAIGGLALLVAAPRRNEQSKTVHVSVPDWLPALINGARAFLAIMAIAIFWIATSWPNGAAAITWAAVAVTIFAPRAEEAYSFVMAFMIGAVISAIFAAIIAFAILPQIDTFAGLCVVLGLFLVPAGAAMSKWQSPVLVAVVALFIPLLMPANEMTYNTVNFYNNALAIVGGTGLGAFFFRVLPPLAPATQTRRLLALTLNDLRRMARLGVPGETDDWDRRMYARLVAMPSAAEPIQRARLLAALSVGEQIIQLCHIVGAHGPRHQFDVALGHLARGEIGQTIHQLGEVDRYFELLPAQNGLQPDFLRARSCILAIAGALNQHPSYFGAAS